VLDLAQVDGLAEPLEAGGRAAVEERRPFRRLDDVDPDHALVSEVKQIDRLDHGPYGNQTLR
jgi:hypothetical protein